MLMSVEINKMDSAYFLKMVRLISGLSLKDVSEKTGFCVSTVSNFENYKIDCEGLYAFYINLCNELGVSFCNYDDIV